MGHAKPSKPVVQYSQAVHRLSTAKQAPASTLRSLYNRLKGDGNEKLTMKVFFEKLLPDLQETFGDIICRRLFEVINQSNDSGALDFESFVCIYCICTESGEEEKLKVLFSMFDLNSNGFIKKKDFKVMSTSFINCKRTDKADNATNNIEDHPMKHMINVMTDTGMMLYDADKNSKLSFAEFCVYAKDDEQCMRFVNGLKIDVK